MSDSADLRQFIDDFPTNYIGDLVALANNSATYEFELTQLEPVVYLYAMLENPGADTATKWFLDIGLRAPMVREYITLNLEKRPTPSWFKRLFAKKDAWGKKIVDEQPVVSNTPAYNQMMINLMLSPGAMTRNPVLYRKDLLVAIINSESPHVEAVLRMVGVSLAAARKAFNVKSIDDIISSM